MVSRQIIVKGLVQGVFFRRATLHKAREFTIAGYVSNLYDGSVIIVATGTIDNMGNFIDWCKIGPPRADVEAVIINEISFQYFTDFKIV
jgi:acylphosphatase